MTIANPSNATVVTARMIPIVKALYLASKTPTSFGKFSSYNTPFFKKNNRLINNCYSKYIIEKLTVTSDCDSPLLYGENHSIGYRIHMSESLRHQKLLNRLNV